MPNIGVAKLAVSRRGERSVVTQQFGKAPLQVHKPLYLDDAQYPTVYLKTPSSGLLEGDEHHLSIKVERGATLEVRTQACTLVYPGRSQQLVDITLEDEAALVFEPHALILAAEADFKQSITISVGAGCSLLFSESWAAGRIAMNERWKFSRFDNTIIIRTKEEIIYREHWVLNPSRTPVEHPLICGTFTHFKNTYLTGSSSDGSGGREPAIASDCNGGRQPAYRTWILGRPGYSIYRTASTIL